MSFREIFSPDFILHNSLLASVLLGLVIPPFGVLLFLWRKSILALALPQVSKLGVALTIALASFLSKDFAHDMSDGRVFVYMLCGSFFTMGIALAVLGILDWQRLGSFEGNAAAFFAISSAGTLALSAGHWIPELGLLNALKGEIVTVSSTMLTIASMGFAVLAAMLFTCRLHLHAILFNHWLALASGLRAKFLTGMLLFLICAAIALGGLCSDPLSIFALLILPPLSVRPFVTRLPMLYAGSSLLGLLGAFIGFYLSCAMENWNLPVSAAQVLVLGICWIGSFSIAQIRVQVVPN